MANDIWTVKRILDWTRGYLERKGDEHPRLSAEWLISDACGLSRMEIYLNFDRPLSPITTNDLHLTWDVPFTRGEIIAVGRDLDGKEIARQVLRPAGKPASLALTRDRTSLPADGRAVAQLELALLDDAGNTVPDADLPVTLEIEGGELLGMDNGRSDDRTPWRSPVRATWRGLAYAVIRAPRSPGTLRVTASAPDLSLATLELACTLPSMSMPLA